MKNTLTAVKERGIDSLIILMLFVVTMIAKVKEALKDGKFDFGDIMKIIPLLTQTGPLFQLRFDLIAEAKDLDDQEFDQLLSRLRSELEANDIKLNGRLYQLVAKFEDLVRAVVDISKLLKKE